MARPSKDLNMQACTWYMPLIGTITLNDGNEFPVIAFGTGTAMWGRDVTPYVEQALDTGFSHIDTAAIYANEEQVGIALRESGLQRSDVYITTKYGGGDSIQQAVRSSLSKLGIKHLDLYLIHWPKYIGDDFEAAWREFETIKKDGLSR